jgi:acetolactate synthase I/II/III large subunit
MNNVNVGELSGADSLLKTLVNCDVEVCFANPGTSEMHFVRAIDKIQGIRAVLGLFEGVVTGAADGYARMTGKPAATLLHLGPGLANGMANLHNARKAQVPMVNIIGNHATTHQRFDAPLTSDVTALANAASHGLSHAEVRRHSQPTPLVQCRPRKPHRVTSRA